MTQKKKERTFWNFFDHVEGDKVVWIILLLLILISIVCIFSSTSRLLTGSETRLSMVRDQLVTVALGLGIIFVCYSIKSIKFFRWCSQWGFALSFILLLMLLTGIDTPMVKSIVINGARRILEVSGLQVHVFEVVKVAMVMYLAWAEDALKRGGLKGPKKTVWKKVLYIYAPFLTILLMTIPGSNSAALLIGGIMLIVILLGGGNLKDMAILGASAAVILVGSWGIYEISDHQGMKRIGTAISRIFDDTDYEQIYLNSNDRIKRQEALDAIRQPYGAKIAIHEGWPIGKGPGQSTQRYIVPDMPEDYMFSFIIEEYGIGGAIVVIFLYVSLLARASIIVKNSGKDTFAKLSVAGLSLLISGQAFLHMFVNVDIGPMTGQTLPLISHGASAFICFSIAFGIILSMSRIAARNTEKMQKNAAPLVQMTENVIAGLGELDDFESGKFDEFNDYGV